MIPTKAENMDAYIAGYPAEVQKIMEEVRNIIRKAAPGVEETISYAMPAFMLNNAPLVYFAAFKNHIGFYAAPTGTQEFEKELAGYKTGKGSVQFPLNKPMPLDLINKIVEFRIKEHLEKTKKNKI